MMRFVATANWLGLRMRPRSPPFRLDDLSGGPSSPTLFRTLRKAVEIAGPHGGVWVFELEALRRVNFADFLPGTAESRALDRAIRKRAEFLAENPRWASVPVPPRAPDPDELRGELELAERQMVAWSERAVQIEKQLGLRSKALP